MQMHAIKEQVEDRASVSLKVLRITYRSVGIQVVLLREKTYYLPSS